MTTIEKPLTLRECLAQPRGTKGRLFEANDDDSTAFKARLKIPDSDGFSGTYRVLSHEPNYMDIEGYMLGGRRKVFRRVPTEHRMEDTVIEGNELMEWYIIAGQTGRFPREYAAF